MIHGFYVLGNLCLTQRHKDFLLEILVLGFTFGLMIHFVWNFYRYKVWVQVYCFKHGCPITLAPFLEKKKFSFYLHIFLLFKKIFKENFSAFLIFHFIASELFSWYWFFIIYVLMTTCSWNWSTHSLQTRLDTYWDGQYTSPGLWWIIDFSLSWVGPK